LLHSGAFCIIIQLTHLILRCAGAENVQMIILLRTIPTHKLNVKFIINHKMF
jgi:hypothetical protein